MPATTKGNGSSPEYAELGNRLREARTSQGLSLRSLAERLGVSPSLLSQVETGRAKPSVSTLSAIVNELGVSLDEMLFLDPSGNREAAAATVTVPEFELEHDTAGDSGVGPMPSEPFLPAGSRKRIRLASGVVWERLTTSSIPNAEFLYVTYEVGGASTHEREFQRHPGREWGYVISGTLGVAIGFDEYVLGPGDAIAFDSTTPHRMHNLGKEPVHGIWFTLGRTRPHVGPEVQVANGNVTRDRH